MKKKQIMLEINDYSDLNKEELESKFMESAMRLEIVLNDIENVDETIESMLEIVGDLEQIIDTYKRVI